MDTLSESTVCLICFQIAEEGVFMPSDESAKIFDSCRSYLHSTLTKETLKDSEELKNENQLPFCKNCLDSALELTQLSEQLKIFRQEISDLAIAFSVAVFHRRSQVYHNQMQNNSQSLNKSSIIEFNVSCLPPSTFATENEDQNILPSFKSKKDNILDPLENSRDINFIDVTNVKTEDEDFQLEADDFELEIAGTKDSSNATNEANDKTQIAVSDLFKSVKMPEIKLKRIRSIGRRFINYDDSDSEENNSSSSVPLLDNRNSNDNSPQPSKVSINPDKKKRFKCFYCEKTFDIKSKRNIHHKAHSNEKPFSCSVCKKPFKGEAAMETHEMTHTVGKPYQCSFCDKQFTAISSVKAHERSHTGEQKRFKCSYCIKAFTTRVNLTVHERKHTGEKPFKCSFCEKRFSSHLILRRHEKSHTGDHTFKCSTCGKGFDSHGTLESHKRIHTGEKPFKCLYCDKTFGQLGNRNSHQKTHRKQQRPSLTCSFCNQKCGSAVHLKLHEKTHKAGEVRMKCSFCEMTFAQNKDRLVHEQSHVKDELTKDFIVGII